MAAALEIRFDRVSRTFQPGETVSGRWGSALAIGDSRVLVTSKSLMKHDGVELSLEGLIGTQKNAALLDNLAYASSKPTTLISELSCMG